MAKNNLPKLKQIQGGLQLRNDVNSLQNLFDNLTASQVATTIEIPDQSGKYYNAAEILKYLNDNVSSSNTDISGLQENVTNLENVQISDYVRIYGTITTEVVTVDDVTTYTYDAAFDDAEKVAELRAQALSENTACVLYTEDNTVITDEHGVPVTINLQNGVLSSKLFIADVENTSQSEEMKYLPITENISFKIFPVGHYTLKTIDKDFLLDNDEMKAVYYQSAIDELAFKLANNSTILKTVQEMIGSKSVSQAIADANAQVTANFQAADKELQDQVTELGKKVDDNETDIEGKVSALDGRVTANEGAIEKLNGDKDTVGSVENSIHAVTDPLANRTTIAENQITKLNGDVNTAGSVANTVKTATDTINTNVTNLTTRMTAAEETLVTLNGDDSVDGSVANTVKTVVDPVKTDLSKVTERVTTNEGDITNLKEQVGENETNITTNATDITNIKKSLGESQTNITNLQETVDRLDEKEETWDEQSEYSNSTAIVQPIGQIKAGDTFENVPITEMLTKILYPYVPFVINKFSVDTAGIYEVGKTVEKSNCVVNFAKKSNNLTSCVIKVDTTKIENGVSVADAESVDVDLDSLISNTDLTQTITKDITRDTTFTLTMTDATTTLSKSASIKFYRPAYFGTVSADTDFTDGSALVAQLNKKVQAPASVNYEFSAFTDMYMVALLPNTWGLTSIKDSNDFDVTKAFTKTTVTVTCLDGQDVTYNLYYSNKCSLTAKSTYKFNK